MASNINPNNIDGSYPVAGQDNNSQGFRDNFTNIKTNFQFAEDEINDLQNKAVLKAALTGQVLDNNMNDALLYAARIQDFSGTKVGITTTTGTVTVNYASGHYQTITTAGPITLAFTNFPPAGTYGYLRIQINITNVAHTVTLPVAVSLGLSGIQGISPGTSGVSNTITFGSVGFFEFAFSSSDQGTTITLFDLNRALTNFTAADIQTDDITATGNVSAAGNVIGGAIFTSTTVSATGNVTGGNVVTSGRVTSTGNVIGGNLVTTGTVTTTGNITGVNLNGFVFPTTGTLTSPPIKFTAGAIMTTPTAGALELDSNVFYATPVASQRGVMPAEQFILMPNAGRVLTQNTSAQAVFDNPTNGQITLAGSTTYQFEGLYVISNTASPSTAHSLSVLFGLGGTLTSIAYIADVTTSVGAPTAGATTVYRNLGTAVTALQVTPAGTTTNTEVIVIRLMGTVRTNAAGTFTPQVQYNTNAPTGISTVLVNSYFKIMSMGTSSVISVGNWA